MKIEKKKKTGHAFTIVELLTVMSIIIILIGLLVPALNRVRRYAQRVKQKAQFHSISVSLDLFNAEYEGYPDSNERDDQGANYCGAMKLAEAMVGQDLKGFNPKSRFRVSGFALPLWADMPYPPKNYPNASSYATNVKSRKRYLELENANAYQIREIYDNAAISGAAFEPNTFVLCDVYTRVTNRRTGQKIGMPVLYYKAHPTNTSHGYINNPSISERQNIYDWWDNKGILDMGMPWAPGPAHPMGFGGVTTTGGTASPIVFYDATENTAIPGGDWPYRDDSYILLSAGFDGEYGTSDDIYNFGE